jgi:hypothetical protein
LTVVLELVRRHHGFKSRWGPHHIFRLIIIRILW